MSSPHLQRLFVLLRGLVLSLMLFSLAACDSSKNPLEQPKPDSTDKRLIGIWKGVQEGHDVYMHVVALQPPFMAAVLITYPLNDYHLGVDRYEFYPTQAGADQFLNIKVPSASSDHKELEWWFAKYNFTPDGALEIKLPDPDKVQDEVKAHKLAGKEWTTSFDANVVLDDSAEKLLKYFQSGDAQSKFKPFATFRRFSEKQPAL